jgi:hypothetical protein
MFGNYTNSLEYIKSLGLTKSLGIEPHIREYLYNFIKENNIKTIIETGVYRGFSSTVFLDAMGSDGLLISIEPFVREDIIVPEKLKKNWIILKGYSNIILPTFAFSKPFDMFWHDGEHLFDYQLQEYLWASKNCKYIGSHDTDHPGAHNKNGERSWDIFKQTITNEIIKEQHNWALAKNLMF